MNSTLLSLIGLLCFLLIAWALGGFKRNISWRIVIGGLLLQFLVAGVLLNKIVREPVFAASENFAGLIQNCSDAGASFVFGINGPDMPGEDTLPGELHRLTVIRTFAFGVLPTVIFFSSLMSVLYYMGLMQWVVRGVSALMQFTLGTTGAETLAASANIFVGHTEAPLVVRPYLSRMSHSELNALMTGGFASVTGSLLIAYASFGAEVGHLLTACFISAPASLVIAKLIVPMPVGEVGAAEQLAQEKSLRAENSLQGNPAAAVVAAEKIPDGPVNVIDAAAAGASDGLKMALNIAAMLIAFLALIYLGNWIIGAVAKPFGFVDSTGAATLTLQRILGTVFAPLAFLIGIPWSECFAAGELLGVKVVANEFVAYEQMGQMIAGENPMLGERSRTLMTYALCGFSNLSAIGIQIGGISALAPERRGDIAALGLRAMLGGLLACNMTACVVGIIIK